MAGLLVCLLTLAAPETGAPTPWTAAPVVLRVSDAVKPGEVIGLYGEGLAGPGLAVSACAGTPAAPPATARPAGVVLADHHGQFAFVRLPRDLPAGLLSLWVRNAHGMSERVLANAPRPQWLSEYAAWPGQVVRVVGMNLAATEFGAAGPTRVRLVPERGTAAMALVHLAREYETRFEVPETAVGSYRVEVSNDGGAHWQPVPDGALAVRARGEDPLGLGVAWAGDFRWRHEVAVRPGSDTAAIQQAIRAAHDAGGGVVKLPPGEFAVTGLRLPAGVVLQGAGSQRTVLHYVGSGAPVVGTEGDGAVEGRQGLAGVSLRVKPGDTLPDIFIVLGQPWGPAAHDGSLRTASRLFCHDVAVDYDLRTPIQSGHRGLGLLMIGQERGLISQCSFRGYYSSPHLIYLNRLFWCHDTRMEFANGVLATSASRCLLERNHIIGHRELVPDEARNPGDSHGLFARDNLLATDNLIEGMGVHEGEAICVENPGGCLTYGQVLAADGPSLTLESAVPFDWAGFDPRRSYYGRWHVVIIAGRGLGQHRPVSGAQGNTVTVARPWTVPPDASSRFSLILPNENVIICRNTARDCTKGFWFYGNVIDAVAADNVSENSEGDFANAYHTPKGVHSMIYFIRMTRERVSGVSPRTKHAGIGFSTSRTSLFTWYGVHSLGLELRDNQVTGQPDAKPFAGSECPLVSGLFGVFYSGFEGEPGCDRVGSLFAGNRLRDLAVGITLGRDNCGTVLNQNAFERVGKKLEDPGSRHLVDEDKPAPDR